MSLPIPHTEHYHHKPADTKLQNLSIAYCELVSLLFLASSQGKSESGRDTAKTSGIVGKTTTVNSRLMAQLSHVQKYIAGLLSHSVSWSICLGLLRPFHC